MAFLDQRSVEHHSNDVSERAQLIEVLRGIKHSLDDIGESLASISKTNALAIAGTHDRTLESTNLVIGAIKTVAEAVESSASAWTDDYCNDVMHSLDSLKTSSNAQAEALETLSDAIDDFIEPKRRGASGAKKRARR